MELSREEVEFALAPKNDKALKADQTWKDGFDPCPKYGCTKRYMWRGYAKGCYTKHKHENRKLDIKRYRNNKEHRDKRNTKARQKYVDDKQYRQKRIDLATKHRTETELGWVMSRLRIGKHYSIKGGFAPPNITAKEAVDKYSGSCNLCHLLQDIKNLVIDHDHKTGEFRGWICSKCNSGLGYFDDNTEKLWKAIIYLRNNQTPKEVNVCKDANPKDIIGSNKVPLSIVPGTTKTYLAIGHLEGLEKYGANNWRHAGARMSVYLDALERHIEKLKGGEWVDPDTNVPHLANAITCLSIIIDAHECGKLSDDRPKSAPVAETIDRMSKNVVELKEKFKDKKPIDYFIDGPKKRGE